MPEAIAEPLPEHLNHIRLLKVPQVCEILGVEKSTLYRYMNRKKNPLPSLLIGGIRRFRADQIAWWQDKHLVV